MMTELIRAISTAITPMVTGVVTESEMYWLTRMTGLRNVVIGVGLVFAILTGVITVISVCCWALGDIKEQRQGKKFFKTTLPCFMVSILILASNVFIPTTKEMCAIKAIPMIVNNNEVQELPNKVVELANQWIEELKPNKESK